jgi:hypothetical protein
MSCTSGEPPEKLRRTPILTFVSRYSTISRRYNGNEVEPSAMVITLEADLETVLTHLARQQGVPAEELALNALRATFLAASKQNEPRDEWERQLLAVATDCGVALSHEAVSSEGLYE